MDENDDRNEETIEQTEEPNENNEIEQTDMRLGSGDHSEKAEMVSFFKIC